MYTIFIDTDYIKFYKYRYIGRSIDTDLFTYVITKLCIIID